MRPPFMPYAFSRVKTRKPNLSPSYATDGSGKSKENFWKALPRGGTNTSLVETSGRMGIGGVGLTAPPRGPTSGMAATAPAALMRSRLDMDSLMGPSYLSAGHAWASISVSTSARKA